MTSEHRVPNMDLPETWPDHAVMSREFEDEQLEWWTRFGDPELDRLVAGAVRDNPDIRLQAARVQEARARLGFAKAEQLPTVGLQVEAMRQRQSEGASGIPGGITNNIFSLAGVVDYELDIWGRLAMERKVAQAALLESRYTHEAVRLSVVSDLAVSYFNLLAAREELEISRQTQRAREEIHHLERIRFEAGHIDELALRQAESSLEAVKALIPGQERQVRTLEGVLGILAGLSPAELFDDEQAAHGPFHTLHNPGPPPMVLPSELLTRRPDIRSAEAGAAAAGTAVGIAKVERLPRLNLAALLGTLAPRADDLFIAPARAWNAGAQLAGPILDFGRTKAGVETARARYLQAEIHYETTVRIAFNEVRDALILYQSSLDRQKAVERQMQTIQRTRDLAWIRYREGMVGLREFLDAEQDLYAARQTMNNAVRDTLTAVATLYKALGGGWDPDSVEAADDSSDATQGIAGT